MARLKYLLFALPILALWFVQMSSVSSGVSQEAGEAAGLRADAGARALAAQLSARRVQLQSIAIQQATSPTAWAALQKGKGTEVTFERWSALREAVLPGIPSALRGTLRIALAADGAALIGGASGNASSPAASVKLPAGDGQPVVQTILGVRYVLVGFPLSGMVVVLGTPLLDEGFLAEQAQAMKLDAVAVIDGAQVVAAAGPHKDAAGLALKARPGAPQRVHSEEVDSFGPFSLPMFAGGAAGGLWGSRQPVTGTPFEVAAVSSAKPIDAALAGGQSTGLLLFFVLVLWTGAWVYLTGFRRGARTEAKIDFGALHQGAGTTFQVPNAGASSFITRVEPPVSEASSGSAGTGAVDDFRAGDAPLAEAAPPPVPVYPFPSPHGEASVVAELATEPEPGSNGAMRAAVPDDDTTETRAYSTKGLPPADIFSNAPETTRVAEIPQELLDRVRSQPNEVMAPPAPPPAEATRASGVIAHGPQGDEAHFQDVYREFVTTRERCGEPPEALTYDRFVGKLRKNRDQLVQKYACRTVRFQVYVKDGKAALKATPVKD